MDRKRTLLISALILAVGAVLTALVFMTEPTAERSGAVRESAMLVDVTGVERGTFRPRIRAMGTVEPAREIVLAPQVAGRVTRVADGFVPGGRIRAGEILLRIEPADYENALEQRRSDLSQARSDLALELGRQDVARQDYELLRDTVGPEDRALVLREPQLEAARARVGAAQAAVEQAELDLERTTIRAPFDAQVLTRNVNVGSQVAPGDALARLVGVDTYWVVATVPQAQLRWLAFPGDGEQGAWVRIRNRTAWEPAEARTGTLHRLVGALEDRTRLARVIIEVPDPLASESETQGPPLMIGSFVEAAIEAEPIRDVLRLRRDYLRDNDAVWVMEDDSLRIRNVEIVFRDAEYAYIARGLSPDATVVMTDLATVVEGAPLRLASDTTGPPTEGAGAPGAAGSGVSDTGGGT
ncbi:MAG: efflux RND transporter periplasmic adaptor subunit [Longimicrobiales bacterium]|nr:efflux RND transporter periplasmic adaptor subunit [Longimicrobiales bacterium]